MAGIICFDYDRALIVCKRYYLTAVLAVLKVNRRADAEGNPVANFRELYSGHL